MKLKLFYWLFVLNLLNISIILIHYQTQKKPSHYTLDRPRNLLVFAAHQDDCVIQAGGLVQQNVKLGGKTSIVYLSSESSTFFVIRKDEAKRAWQSISPDIQLYFLDIFEDGNWNQAKINDGIEKFSTLVKTLQPDLINIPLAENGHPAHDAANTIGWHVAGQFSNIEILQSAEYNSFYSTVYQPFKSLQLLLRIIPLLGYVDRPSGLDPANQSELLMSSEERAMKKQMLSNFTSQHEVIKSGRFHYPDLFESTRTIPKILTIHFKKKYFDPWTLLTMGLFAALVFFIGISLGVRTTSQKIAVSCLIGFAIYLIMKSSTYSILVDDLFVVLLFLFGMFCSWEKTAKKV